MTRTPHTKTDAIHEFSSTIDKKSLSKSYQKTLSDTRVHLSTPEKILSRTLHWRPLELFLGLLSSTLLRPIPILFGAIGGIIIGGGLYGTAKYFGYLQAGSELIVGFLIGWIIGICYDYLLGLFQRQ